MESVTKPKTQQPPAAEPVPPLENGDRLTRVVRQGVAAPEHAQFVQRLIEMSHKDVR